MKNKKKNQKAELLFSFLNGTKLYFFLTILFAGVTALADMIQPQIIRLTVDNVIEGKPSEFADWVNRIIEKIGGFGYLKEHIWIPALAVVIVAAVQIFSQYSNRVYNTKASETLVKNMRDRVFTHIEHLPFSWFMQNKTGDIIQRCTSDIETTKNFLSEQLTSIFRIILMLVLSISFMVSMNPLLTLIALIPMPFIVLSSFFFHKKMHRAFRECDENEGKLSAMAQENLTGVRVVRAFGQERSEIKKFKAQNKFYTDLWIKMSKLMGRFWTLSDVVSGLQVMIVVVVGAVFCVKRGLSNGEYIAFISYNAILAGPFRQLGRMISDFSRATVSIDRIFYIMNSPIEADEPDAVEAPMDGDIKFENVCFGYENSPELLHNISFEMKAGSTLGILGGTGSGKSTLMLLLDKLYDLPPQNGKITIGSTDIRKIKTEHLRKNIGMVLQEPFLFSRTVYENIGIADDSLTLEDVRAAAKAAALDDSITSFPKAYDTLVGERGVTLSGGQKQRTAIARMLIGNYPIMIFDDSLSAVDTQTDAKIRKEISKHFGKASVILISHRITTLSSADKIIVLDHGKISEEGTHDELKSAGGIYQKIYETQTNTEEAI